MIKKLFKIENIFLITALVWGVLFLLVNPPFQAPDEPEHMFKMWGYTENSYRFKIKDGWAGQILPANFDVLYQVYDNYRMSSDTIPFKNTITAAALPLDKYNTTFVRFTPSSYTPVSYFPSFIVLWVLKIFNASPIFMMYILRFCSLLVYLALIYCAIKITPVKKYLFLIFSIMPLCVYQAASISTDGITFGVLMILLAYTLKLAYDDGIEKISLKQKIIWSVLCVVTGILKFAYLPLILIYFLIPQEKFNCKKDYIKTFLTAFLISITVVCAFLAFTMSTSAITKYAYENHLLSPREVLKNTLSHPVDYIFAILKTVKHLFWFMSKNMISSIGITLAMIPPQTAYLYWVLLFAATFYKTDNEKNITFSIKQILLVLTGVLISFFIMITAVHLIYQTKDYIFGIQGRYLTPFIPFVLILLSGLCLKGKTTGALIFLGSQYVLFVTLITIINRYY